jgi:hypothetical protein
MGVHAVRLGVGVVQCMRPSASMRTYSGMDGCMQLLPTVHAGAPAAPAQRAGSSDVNKLLQQEVRGRRLRMLCVVCAVHSEPDQSAVLCHPLKRLCVVLHATHATVVFCAWGTARTQGGALRGGCKGACHTLAVRRSWLPCPARVCTCVHCQSAVCMRCRQAEAQCAGAVRGLAHCARRQPARCTWR